MAYIAAIALEAIGPSTHPGQGGINDSLDLYPSFFVPWPLYTFPLKKGRQAGLPEEGKEGRGF